jgi:hypothetical protein
MVKFHEKFEPSVHELETEIPNIREYLDGLKWRLEHGELIGEYIPEIDCYRITFEVCQVFYCISDPLGSPRVLTVLAVRRRPDY